jgi:alkylation response protein AidB-like acyl-CoA dehydrogenase
MTAVRSLATAPALAPAEPADSAGFAVRFQDFCDGALAAAPIPGPESLYSDNHPLWQEFQAAGLANWWLPTGLGGPGISLHRSVELVARLAYLDPGFAFTSFLSILAARMLELYGNPGPAGELLSQMSADGSFCAALGSETAAGSELANTRTTFRRVGGRIVINGEKAFSTNLGFAGFCLVLARNEDDARDFSMITVPRGTAGFEVGQRWQMSGLQGTGTYPAGFVNCSVPADHELNGNGMRILEVGLNASRILMSSISIGIARRVRDISMDYAGSKQLGERPLQQNAVFAARMGQLESELESLKSVCLRAATDYDQVYFGPDPARSFYRYGVIKSAIMAKMHCGRTGWKIVSDASEGFGGLGYTEHHPIQRLMRDMRHISIVEGGDDVLRQLTYGRYVKRPSQRG